MPVPSPWRISIDGPNRIIQILEIANDFDAKDDFYSVWKQWAQLDDNLKYPPAFDTTGGDQTTATQQIAAFYFLRNDLGWRIKAPEMSGEVVIEGDIFPRDPGVAAFVEADGTFNNLIRLIVSSKSLVDVVTTISSGLTASESEALLFIQKLLRNKMVTDPGTGVLTLFDDDNTTPLVRGDLFEDEAESIRYRGRGAEVRTRLEYVQASPITSPIIP